MSRRITIIIARENFVNLIIAAEVFEHLYSLINFIAKTARVLKPGGSKHRGQTLKHRGQTLKHRGQTLAFVFSLLMDQLFQDFFREFQQ
jgi:cyclopropane fatty-acyl-phospholipid synthase-like methyltransferase